MLNSRQHSIKRKDISVQAIRVLEGLQKAGFQAYLVGGCIRDLLSGETPKDFDVSTNATQSRYAAYSVTQGSSADVFESYTWFSDVTSLK